MQNAVDFFTKYSLSLMSSLNNSIRPKNEWKNNTVKIGIMIEMLHDTKQGINAEQKREFTLDLHFNGLKICNLLHTLTPCTTNYP